MQKAKSKDAKVAEIPIPKPKRKKFGHEDDVYWYFGGLASACTSCFTHQLDTLRVHMQAHSLKRLALRDVITRIVKHNGYHSIYQGLLSNVQHQLLFSAARFRIYDIAKNHGHTKTVRSKIAIAGLAGLVAGFISTPVETVNIRMRADLMLPVNRRYGYRNILDGILTLYIKDGSRRLLAAGKASAVCGMIQTIGQIAIYHELKETFIDRDLMADNWHAYFVSSSIAGAVTAVILCPLEVIKCTRMYASVVEYRTNIDAVNEILILNGFKGFYKGFMCTFLYLVPQTILTFLIYEQLHKKIQVKQQKQK